VIDWSAFSFLASPEGIASFLATTIVYGFGLGALALAISLIYRRR